MPKVDIIFQHRPVYKHDATSRLWYISFSSRLVNNMAAISQTTFSNAFFIDFFISIRISSKFVPKGPIDNNSTFVQVMAWRRTGDKPLHEAMLTQFADGIYAALEMGYLGTVLHVCNGIINLAVTFVIKLLGTHSGPYDCTQRTQNAIITSLICLLDILIVAECNTRI